MIDWARIATLREEIGTDCFEEVVALFLEEVEESIARLRNGLQYADLGPELHFLKGCALNLGFCEFSTLCQAGEALCESGRETQVDLATILTSYDRSKTAFLEGLEQTN
jgi:HPt (histidine-containing phosphotransfer) domain-containing protein